MTQFAKETGINWVDRKANSKDFVAIQKGKGCSSAVGRQGGPQILSLSSKYYLNKVLPISTKPNNALEVFTGVAVLMYNRRRKILYV
jgi:hypothetical protein